MSLFVVKPIVIHIQVGVMEMSMLSICYHADLENKKKTEIHVKMSDTLPSSLYTTVKTCHFAAFI